MGNGNKLIEDELPRLESGGCRWNVGKCLSENNGLALLGVLDNHLSRNEVSRCYISFELTEWADPLPLIFLALVLRKNKNINTLISLGKINEKDTSEHAVFLKFISEQGFLIELSQSSRIALNGRNRIVNSDMARQIESTPARTHYRNSDCLLANIFSADEYSSDRDNLHSALQEKVEKLVSEAGARAIEGSYKGAPYERDLLYQKLRKILFELILNAADHAYSQEEAVVPWIGVYARLRGARPEYSEDAEDWDRLYIREKTIYGQRKFAPNIYANWIELYVCDVGEGLTRDLGRWKDNSKDSQVKQLLTKAIEEKNKKNILHSASGVIFTKAVSKDPRHDKTKTEVTGLKDIGHMLKEGRDYCRIYESGNWVGNHHPWGVNKEGNPTCSQKSILFKPLSLSFKHILEVSNPVRGTGYAFSIQPHGFHPESNKFISSPSDETLSDLADTLRFCDRYQGGSRVECFDYRVKDNCTPPNEEAEVNTDVLVLRPPRLVSKEDVSSWLTLLAGQGSVLPEWSVSQLIIAELTPFQTLWFCTLFRETKVHRSSRLEILVVSEDWGSAAFSTHEDSVDLAIDKFVISDFVSHSASGLSVFELALLLREIDSIIFWRDNIEHCVYHGTIKWGKKRDNEEIILKKYLDFPYALTLEGKYRACRRALKRCLSLFPGLEPLPGDELVESLVKDATMRMGRSGSECKESVVVDSVAVTTSTAKKFTNRKYKPAQYAVHILSNIDSDSGNVQDTLRALLWVDKEVGVEDVATRLDERDWRRISNTPYIAPYGEASISVLRYRRNKDGSLDFNRSWFGRTPKQMYMDFSKLDAIKLGHWDQNSRHDLLTANVGVTLEYSKYRKGSMYKWLCSTLKRLTRDTKETRRFLVYPSHYTTDRIISNLQHESFFVDLVNNGELVPIKLIGHRVVSPLLVPSLVKERVNSVLEKSDKKAWEAILFDDGLASGRHINELSQTLSEMGARSIYTVALLDRTGSPISEKAIKKQIINNKRYWKWDVPGLGSRRDCAICQALNILTTYTNKLHTPALQNRISQWWEEWHLLDASSDWHYGGVAPIRFDDPIYVTFGIDIDSVGNKNKQRIPIYDSIQLSSVLAELTRLTTRSDVAINKANLLCDKLKNYEAALQVLAVQLIQFIDEFSYWEKRERYLFMLGVLAKMRYSTKNTSLAGLCFILIDKELIPDVWHEITEKLLISTEILNTDLAIVVSVTLKKASYYYGLEYGHGNPRNEVEAKNYCYISIGESKEFIRAYMSLFRIPYTRLINMHSGPYMQALEKIPTKSYSSINEVREDLAMLVADSKTLSNVINGLKRSGYRELKNTDLLDSHIETLERLIEKCENTTLVNDNCVTNAQAIVEEVQKVVSGKARSGFAPKHSLLWNITSNFFRTLKADTYIENLLSPIVQIVNERWDLHVVEKASMNPKIAKRWIVEGKIIKPSLMLSSTAHNRGKWERKLYLLWDVYTLEVIRDALSNVIYSEYQILDPFSEQKLDIPADMWWNADVNGDHLVLTFANSLVDKSIHNTHNYRVAGFERLGGERSIVVENGFVKVIFCIPLDSKYL
ncbi:hypothetical protein A3197_17245 [Candidatus Thiodiazotropha endoloripes]|nr:hypothetical protein A3197_17245 [Candidatus Thiodiazotropha endoloripes]